MDAERDELVAALRQKLTELDAQVVAFRRDRADEFRQYATDLLKPVSDSVTAEVAKIFDGPSSTIAKDFDALYPGFLDAGDAKSIIAPPLSRTQGRRTVSPPPVLYHTSGIPKEGPRRPPSPAPRRESELDGFFSLPFLPLLDSSSDDRRPNSIAGVYNDPTVRSTAQRDADAATAAQVAASEAAAATAVEEESAAARAAALTPPPPPEPKLKSALRRTSSISSSRSSTPTIKSPTSSTRHVRFLFGGEEVLPTESPPSPMSPTEEDLSWLMHNNGSYNAPYDDMGYEEADMEPTYAHAETQDASEPEGFAQDSLSEIRADDLDTARGWGSEDQDTSGAPAGDESQVLAQGSKTVTDSDTAALQSQSQTILTATDPLSAAAPRIQPRRQNSKILDDDLYDFAPLSRKVSSSDRLRALSKMPLEDPSMWTVVNPQASPGDSAATATPSVNEIISTHHQWRLSQQQQLPSPTLPTVDQVERIDAYDAYDANDTKDDDESSSDDDDVFVAMRPTRKASLSTETLKKEPGPPAVVPAINDTATADVSVASEAGSNGTATKPLPPTKVAPTVQFADSVPSDKGAEETAEPDEDDLFAFEDGVSDGGPLRRTSHVDLDLHDDFDDAEDEPDMEDESPVDDADLVAKEEAALGIGTDGLDSRALDFNHRKVLGAATNSMSTTSSSPPGPHLGASVGSYRGHNLDLFNVVKDPEVLQQAAELGELDSFVGSIHEGLHPSTFAEFSSLSGPDRMNLLSGTPKSLTERMMMEDVRKHLMSSSARQH